MNLQPLRIKCVLTVLLLPLFVQAIHSATKPPDGDLLTNELQLNIVFHGLFSYIIWPDHIEVLAPEVDEHVYKAGTWGKEMRLEQSVVYQLTGVQGEKQAPQLDSDNLVLRKVAGIDRNPAKLFCSFILPLPMQIKGLRHARANGPVVAGRSLSAPSPVSVPLVQTLVYKIDNLNQLGFGHLVAWTPETNETGTVNLHVWAEPEVDPATMALAQHPEQAFSRLMELFPGADLHLEYSAGAPPDKISGVRGLNGWEENSLVERSQLLFPPKLKKHKGKGTEVSNCVGLFIVNN